jgi:outer membrane protein TolC
MALLAATVVLLAGGQDADGQRRGRKGPKQSSKSTPQKPQPKKSTPASPTVVHTEVGPEEGDVETVELRLEDVVRSALEYSPAVRRAELDWKTASLEIGRKEARFDPVLGAEASGGSARDYNQYATDVSQEISTIHTASLQASLNSLLRTGATYSVIGKTARTNETRANPLFRPITPVYTNELSGRISQPLARGRGYKANAAQIDREAANTELLQAQGRELRLAVALQAVSSYWALVLRREELKILETNVAEAITLKEIVERRVRAGQDPQSSLVQAAAAIAERVQAVEAARVAIVDAERALLGDAYLPESKLVTYSQVPVPVEQVDENAPPVDFQKELVAALKNRPEAVRMQEELKLAKLDQSIASDKLRVRFDIFAVAGIRGLAGRSNVPAGGSLAQPPDLLQGGVGKSLGNLAGFNAPFYEIGVQFELPLGNVDAKNAYRQSKIAVQRAKAQNVESRISLDIRAASQRVRIAASSLNAAKESLRLSQENVKAMKLRYQGGGATLFDVTRSQDEVTQSKARTALARAQIAVAKAGLEAAQGTLLKRFGVEKRFGD